MISPSKTLPTTEELLLKRSEEENKHIERLSNPTYQSADESAKRGAVLLKAVFGESRFTDLY